mmetsp:Transcript_15249/g.40216  ORF Transcript_15249/g.40216 Transcript_15249/m.40216 type:complete len:174 (-) Transcript_15249:355-876(-)
MCRRPTRRPTLERVRAPPAIAVAPALEARMPPDTNPSARPNKQMPKPDMNTRKRLAAMLEDGEEKKKQKRGRGRPKKQEGKEPVRNINASETVYEIENILDVRWRGSQREYFISWKDYSDKVNSKWLLPVSRALLFGALALRLVVWGGHEADGDLIRLHATRVAPAGGTGTLV